MADARDSPLSEINTTPLIDVMLVLLVTLIVSLPILTHAVKLDLPQAASITGAPPQIIELDIDADGTVVWNGRRLGYNTQELEGYLREAALREPQPEVHLRADRRVKYDFVAKVLASTQRNGIKRVSLVDTVEFRD
jgi:biopolymer transport protein ExbD